MLVRQFRRSLKPDAWTKGQAAGHPLIAILPL